MAPLLPTILIGGNAEQLLWSAMKTGRNDPCPCGSGKKLKKCCLAKETEAFAAAVAASAAADQAEAGEKPPALPNRKTWTPQRHQRRRPTGMSRPKPG